MLDERPSIRSLPSDYWAQLSRAVAGRDVPCAVLQRQALSANADDLVRRAAGRPIRVASKSIRVRELIVELQSRPGFAGVLAFTLPEALDLARRSDIDDIVVGYPTAEPGALAELVADAELCSRITLTVDSPDHLDLIDAVAPPRRRAEVRVSLEVDASLDLPGWRMGVWRSPVHTPAAATAAALAISRRAGFVLDGLMLYEAQLAGVGDAAAGRVKNLAVRGLQAVSRRELAARRAEVVAAVRTVTDLRFVNGGGTGSLEFTAADPFCTEVAAGSGLFGPTLFDGYRGFTPLPAAAFCTRVVRQPRAGVVTVLGGGWIASGPPGSDRSPSPVWPPGLRTVPLESVGEVQTPLAGAGDLAVGDLVWWRHAKAGELSEHVNHYLVVDGSTVVGEVQTYRGEGRSYL